MGFEAPVIVTHFPISQAALAKQTHGDAKTALRFEVYVNGIELANGYEELQDADIQVKRMEQDNQHRIAMGKPTKEIDVRLISALRHGLPQCSGVALGLDRLLMIMTQKSAISEVISFDSNRA